MPIRKLQVLFLQAVVVALVGCQGDVSPHTGPRHDVWGEESLRFCRHLADSEKRHDLTQGGGVTRLSSLTRSLALEINRTELRGVDPTLVDWSGRYTELLLDMHECLRVLAARETQEYAARRMLESFIRGTQGDPFGVTQEELSLEEWKSQLIAIFETRRLTLLLEFQRLFNSKAPEGTKVDVSL